ncbi:MAG: L-threonylcarbamoyladenylate synthase, partial [Candidatus Binataceae bacterium]
MAEKNSVAIADALAALAAGEAIVYPTETFYALGVDALSLRALDRLFAIKGREPGKPVALIAADTAMAFAIAREVPAQARVLAQAFWPGPLTLVLPARAEIPAPLVGTDGGVGDAMLFCAVVFFNVSYQRGTLRDIVPLVEQMAIDAPGLAAILSPVVALAHLEEGRIDDAARLLEEFATAGFELPMDQLWLGAMTTRAEFAIQCRLASY